MPILSNRCDECGCVATHAPNCGRRTHEASKKLLAEMRASNRKSMTRLSYNLRRITGGTAGFVVMNERQDSAVNHPQHYGGGDNPYEAIKVIDAWGLGFCLGNTVKYIARAGKKGDRLEDLEKALWYLRHEIERLRGGVK